MTAAEREETARIRRAQPDLPGFCECGGAMLYTTSGGRVFSCCDQCTPVVHHVVLGPSRKQIAAGCRAALGRRRARKRPTRRT